MRKTSLLRAGAFALIVGGAMTSASVADESKVVERVTKPLTEAQVLEVVETLRLLDAGGFQWAIENNRGSRNTADDG